jgi:hypothetical protein
MSQPWWLLSEYKGNSRQPVKGLYSDAPDFHDEGNNSTKVLLLNISRAQAGLPSLSHEAMNNALCLQWIFDAPSTTADTVAKFPSEMNPEKSY